MNLSSRLRSDVATLFDVFCIAKIDSTVVDPGASPVVTLSNVYPPEFSDEPTLRSIRQFSFPCGVDREDTEAVQLFTFVLTDAQSLYTFAYCRYTPRFNTCFCILSGLPWTNLFYKILNHLSTVSNKGSTEDLESVLTNAYHIDIPPPGGRLSLNACTWKFSEEVPDPCKLPTLRDDKFMLEFYNAVTEKQMIVLYSSLLKERRIIFTSKKLSQLSSCVFAASRLLYPFHWQNLFIPILPMDLTDMLMAPMPFIIGVPKRTFQGLNKRELGELVVVDLDEKTFESAHNDVLPVDAIAYLKSLLKSPAEMFTSDSLARAFLRTNVFIFGKYRLGFVRKGSTMEVKWDREKFVRDQRQSLQPYLESLIGRDGVQYFERFVDERLDAVNKGLPINDEFEREIASFNQRGYPERTSLLQKDAPEMLHNAVASVRENATDMIGALKDRVQGMSLRNKLGRLTPSELRRHRKGKGKKKRLKPLSVDATVFDWNNPLAPTSAQNGYDEAHAQLDDSTSDAESAKSLNESDLIDFSDDTAIETSGSASTSARDNLLGTSAPSEQLEFQPFRSTQSASLLEQIEHAYTQQRAAGAATQPSASSSSALPEAHLTRVSSVPTRSLFSLYPTLPSSSSSSAVPKKNWETFD